MDADKKLSQEYSALRSEILIWISVQYTLIAITASVTVILLSIFRTVPNWTWFSSVMIFMVSCLGLLIAHAHAKVTMAGAYISVFHSQRTIWDHLIYSKLKFKWTIATMGFFPSMLLFYLALYIIIILYPYTINKKDTRLDDFYIFIIPTLFYILMLIVLWRSEKRETYEKIWKNFKNNS